MRSRQAGPIIGLVSQLMVLLLLAVTVGVGLAGWGVGIVYTLVCNSALVRGLARRGTDGFGPADWVTLLRASMVCGIAALVADSFNRTTPVVLLVSLSVVSLVLDAVDGRVARSTGTVSAFGARFDMEVDAFLILTLSVYVAPMIGIWVLAIGAARYVFVAASWRLRWLRAATPPRYWAKVVAAIQGIVLTAAAADVLPRAVIAVALALALALLAESFGRQVWWLWRHRQAPSWRAPRPSAALTIAAGVFVWFVLVVPVKPSLITPVAFVRIPLEGLGAVVLALVLPAVGRRVLARVFGVLLGLLIIVKVLDVGFFAVFDRPFDAVSDWYYLGPGVGVLSDSIGRFGAYLVATLIVVAAAWMLTMMPSVVARLIDAVGRRRRVSARAVVALGIVSVLFVATGVQIGSNGPVASAGASKLVYGQLQHDIADRATFAAQISHDPLRDVPADTMFTSLRGKDVILAFVESYGRVAVHGSSFSPGIDAVLKEGTSSLRAAGFSSRSAFLTSPTFGAGSWLAHSTLQSGLWVNSQQRYDQLFTEKRVTLTSAFGAAGWRTVSDVPADTIAWPQGAQFYGFDALYDSKDVGYRGPAFSYAPMPDQYVWSAFQRLELGKPDRPPIMAEIDLVSSHHPWTPLPHFVPWGDVGDGSVFNGMPEQGQTPDDAFESPSQVRALYGQSIEYTLSTLFSYLTTYPDPNLVMIVVGDHQPHSYVSGPHPGHDVPISIIAHDPAVLDSIGSWGWQDGMLPSEAAPVWKMSAFRNRFVAAYSPGVSATLPDPFATPVPQPRR